MQYGSIQHELLCKAICAAMLIFLVVLAIIVNVMDINAASKETTIDSIAVPTTLADDADEYYDLSDLVVIEEVSSSAEPLSTFDSIDNSTNDSDEITDDLDDPIEKMEEQNYVEENEETTIEEDAEEEGLRLLTATVNNLNIRTSGDASSEVLGQLSEGDYSTILDVDEDWYKIESGDVIGWVNKEYVVTDEEAEESISENSTVIAISNVDLLKVRTEPDIESDAICAINENDSLPVSDEEVESADWIGVIYGGKTRYVYSEYVTVETQYEYAESIEEIEARLKAEAEAEAAAKAAEEAAKNKTTSSSSTTNSSSSTSSTSVSSSDKTLLAAIIYCEAGPGNGQGQIAVGAVVMNRVKSSSFPNTISGVIYQSDQFVPVKSGKLSKVLSNGSYTKCLDAAQAALDGQDPTGGCLYFLSASECQHSGTNIGGNIFFKRW